MSLPQYTVGSRDKYNRDQYRTTRTYTILNTYKNWQPFDGVSGAVANRHTGEGDRPMFGKATRSIFNKYANVLLGNTTSATQLSSWRQANNIPLLDSPDTRKSLMQLAACSVKDLVEASYQGFFGKCPYDYADFMYCAKLGVMPNNYMVTLRRFPVPVTDAMVNDTIGVNRKKESPTVAPIGTMITWMGVSGNEMNQLLKYSYKMPYEFKNAGWQQVDKEGGESGIFNTIEAALNKQTREAFIRGEGISQLDNSFLNKYGAAGRYKHDPDKRIQNKLYGPIDRVKGTYQRSESGLEMDMKLSLVFEYELKAYNGINPKQAMLDLLSNILSVTYTCGDFWKGGYIGEGVPQSSIYRNLNIFKAAQRGASFTGFFDAFVTDAKQGLEAVQGSLKNPTEAAAKLLNLANQIGGMLIGGLLNKYGRPARYSYPALLSEGPIGLWHVVIGNPKRPILTLGNMVVTNTTIEHSGPLGIDDFPTKLKVTVELDRGTPRDQVGIENMYMQGSARIAPSMDEHVIDIYNHAQKLGEGKDFTPVKGYSEIVSTTFAANPNTTPVENVADDGTSTHEPETVAGKANVKTHEITPINFANSPKEMMFCGADNEAIIMSAREMYKGYFEKVENKESSPYNNKTTEHHT